LRASDAGSMMLDQANQGFDIELQMEAECGLPDTAQGELELFLVDASARGHGVGGSLWRHAMQYFAQERKSGFFLHTDSTCDVGFYDHKGLNRINHRDIRPSHSTLADEGVLPEDLFIYAGDVKQFAEVR